MKSIKQPTHFLLSFILFFCLSNTLNAQIDFTIGNGITTNNGTTYPCPIQDYYEGSRMQFLYSASELTSVGMYTGLIDSVKYRITTLNGVGLVENFKITIGHTSINSLSTTVWDAFTGITSSTITNDYTPVVGINSFALTSAFLWNGTDNILVEICNGSALATTTITYTNNPSIPLTSGLTFNGSHNFRIDNLVGPLCTATTNTNTGLQTDRPNIIFSWSAGIACSGIPNAGIISADNNPLCYGQSAIITPLGASINAGLKYQWEDSTKFSSSFSTRVNDTLRSLSVSPNTTTWYKLKMKCKTTNDSSYSNVLGLTVPSLLGGTYTINKNNPTTNTNFQSFNEAYNSLKCGISGPVVFNVVAGSGPYNEQLIINGKIPNSNATNTITFNGNGNTIAFAASNNNEMAVIKLKGAKYFIFDSISVDASNGSYGIGFHLLKDADSNIIRKCNINASLTNSTAGLTAGIAISGIDNDAVGLGATLCDGNLIANNTINGGYYGITQTATYVSGACVNNIITNNVIKDFYNYGIYVNGSIQSTISNNKISRPTRTFVGTFNGIYFTGQSSSAIVNANRIFSPYKAVPTSTLAFNGIYFNNATAAFASDNVVFNNLIYDVVNLGIQYGIINTSSSNIEYLHNTISLDDASSTSAAATTIGYYNTNIVTSVIFTNNIITIGRSGTGIRNCIYLSSNPVFIDNNNYYISSPTGTNYIGYIGSIKQTLTDWKSYFLTSGMEQNSWNLVPNYVQPIPPNELSNYAPNNAALDNKGFNVGVNADINGNARDISTPDIGAYEFTPTACVPTSLNGNTTIKILGKTIIGDTIVCEGINVTLDVTINGAYGSSHTFQWQRVRDTLLTPKPFLPLLNHPDTTFKINDTSYYYRCKLSCSGTDYFTNWRKINSNPSMPAGNYTINAAIATNYIAGANGSNFSSFNAANASLKQCGVRGNGNVIFNVVPLSGPYIEQLKIDSVVGVNASNQVYFKGNGNTIQFAPTIGTERAVIKLNKADFITIDSLFIDASAGVGSGYGIQLINNADSNTIKNCFINANTTEVTQYFAGIVINSTDAGVATTGNTLCDGNIIDKNTINGGYYGITLVGGTALGIPIENNKITNNKFLDFYNTGLFVAGTNNSIINGNLFSRPTRTLVGVGYGIQLTSSPSYNTIISNNTFTSFYGGNPTNTLGTICINFNNVDATFGNENLVYNNVFYNLDGLGGVFALYNTGSDYVNYFYNSISIDNPSSTSTVQATGFYQNTTAIGIQFKNNIIRITRGGTGNKYCINLNTQATATGFISNNNVLNIESNVINGYIGYLTTTRSTLANWQNANSPKFDSLSYSFDPLFTDVLTGNLKPKFYLIDNKAVNVGILKDITGLNRSATPDIGAYEFSPLPCAIPLIAGTATVSPSAGNCLGLPIQLNLTGNSPIGSINFQWQDSIAGGSWQNLGVLRYSPQYDTITNPRNFYRCIVTCASSGVSAKSTVVSKDISGSMPAGTYTIDSALGTNYTGIAGQNFKTITEAVTAMQCGIKGSVVFNVKKGTYNEQVIVPVIPGATVNSTITFLGFNVGVADAKIIANNTTATNNYIVRFDSAQYVIFKNISIENTNSVYGRVIEFANGTSNINLLNCNIKAPIATSNSINLAAIYSATTKGKNITIKGNTIANGSYGVYYAGTSASVLAPAENKIDSNIISGTYSSSIFVQFTNRLSVTKNYISMQANAGTSAAGIYANYCDSAFNLSKNTININNTVNQIYGLFLQNCRSTNITGFATVNGNEVYANSGNTASISGIHTTSSSGLNVTNNVIAINSSGANAYGFVNTNNIDNISVFNNSISLSQISSNTVAVQLTQTVTGNFKLANNVINNSGGGRVIVLNNAAANYRSDYNMLYTTGNIFFTLGTTNYTNINSWKTASYLDINSIVYQPSFVSPTDLHPNLSDSNSWAMNGRGIQIKGNNKDIDGNYRPDSLTAGVPDLGAYEFTPTIAPPNCSATPASPAPNTTQTFYLGSDTVMKIKWNATVPPSIGIKRYSGVTPPNINNPARSDSMFFYTKIDVPAGSNYNCDVQLNYLDNWLGSFPSYYEGFQLGLGETNSMGKWQTRTNSGVNKVKKIIFDSNITQLDKLTGLMNLYCIWPINYPDTSNKGKEFWLAYPANQLSGGETYQLYLSANEAANVTVSIPCLNSTKTYNISANTVIVSDILPQIARHDSSGKYCDGINILSDVPIVAYAHCWGSTSSGATMLLPTGVWGYDYKMLGYHENWGGFSKSSYFVIAKEDNTKVSIANVVPVTTLPQVFDTVLNKGEWLQVLAASNSDDLTGSSIKSVSNANGNCYPIAVFSGDTRTLLSKPCGGGGDFLIQQNFPTVAWGKKYLTAPTSRSTGSGVFESNLFRILLKDATQSIWINNTLVYSAGNATGLNALGTSGFIASTTLIPGTTTPAYLQFLADSASYIVSNKPIMVAQYLSGACTGVGDPEMMYLSPLEQGVNSATFYRNNVETITVNVLTLIGATANVPQLLDGGISALWTKVYPHPNYPGKSIYIKHWPVAAKSQVSVYADSSFTGITYGLGSVESYGYNIGTMVNNLTGKIKSSISDGVNTNATCVGKAFQINTKVSVLPDSISWQFDLIPSIHPHNKIVLKKPYTPAPSFVIQLNGDSLYTFTLPNSYYIDSSGYYPYTVKIWNQEIEGCNKSAYIQENIQILPSFSNSKNVNICSSQLPYVWKGTSYLTSGTYYKTVSNIGTCDSNLILILNVIDKPIITTLSYNNPVSIGNSIVLNVTASGSNLVYNWTGPLGFTSTNQNPIITSSIAGNAGTYYVSISNGVCISRDSIVVVFNGSSLSISGRIITASKKIVNNSNVHLSGNSISTLSVDVLGNYKLGSLINGNYKLKASKNNDITKANGVNATDVLFTQRHILNTTKLNSAYKLIAADVNGDKNINATDVLRIKRLILGTDTTFTSATKGNRLWEFVDSAYIFPDTTNPFPFKDSISFTNLTSNKINQTFIGVKLGDVNYDWNPLVARVVEVKPVELVYHVISTKEESQNSYRVQNPIRVKVTANNFKELVAMQYTLHFDNIKYEFVGIENNNLNIDFNSKQASENGNITMLWTDKNAVERSLEDETELFVLVLQSTVNSRLSTDLKLTLTNDITEVAAWDKDLNEHEIILSKRVAQNDKLETINELVMYPNPATDIVNIDCSNARQMIIIDVMGKTIKQWNNTAQHQTINTKQFTKGIYIVQVTFKDGTIKNSKLVVE